MKKYNKKSNYSYSLGVFPTLELLLHKPHEVMRVLLSEKSKNNPGLDKIISVCEKYKIPFEYNDKSIDKVSQKENTYALGVFKKYNSNVEKGNHIVLVNPSDRGNLGTISRTMLGLGFENLVIIGPAVDIFHPTTIGSSMGALFQVKFQYFSSFEEYKSKYSDNKFYPFMLQTDYSLNDIKLEQPFSLIFGNEGSGLSDSYLNIGEPVKIPQTNKIDSLNLAISVALACYEANRQLKLV